MNESLLFFRRQRLQILNQIALLLRGQPEAEARVVVIHHIQQRREAPVVIVPTLIRRTHKPTVLTNEDAGQVHRLVNIIRSAISLETIDANFRRRVQVPARLGPQWLNVAGIAIRLDRKSTRLNSSYIPLSRMPSSA